MIDPPPCVHHLRRGGPTCLERRDEMGVDQVVELRAGDVEDRLAGQPCGARTVHQDVDAAEFAYAPVDQRVGDLRVSRRTWMCDRAFDAVGRFGCRVSIAAVYHDARAFGGEQFGYGQPDAPGPADDDSAASG